MKLFENIRKHEKLINRITSVLLLLSCIIMFVLSLKNHYNFLVYPYQLEYREGAGLSAAQDFLQNENPYDLSQQPQHTYIYGFLYPYLVSKAANVYGNTLFVHRAFTYFFLTATSVIIFFVLLRMKAGWIFSFAGLVFLQQSLINASNTSTSRPEGLGIFLMTFGIIIPWFWNYNRISLYASIVLGILGFLTKQYYLFVIPAIVVYLFLFVSKKKAMEYFLTSVVSLILTLVILDYVFPLYLSNTLFTHLHYATYSYQYMKDQVAVFAEVNVYLILIIVLSCIFMIRQYLETRSYMSINEIFQDVKKLFVFESASTLSKPLISSNGDLLFPLTLMLALFIFMINLGGHTGNYMAAYLFQLASPFLILVTFQTLNSTKDLLFRSFACLVLIITLNVEFGLQKIDFERFTSCFIQIEEIIKSSKSPLNSPENVSVIIQEGKPVHNSGHSEYFLSSNHKTERTNDYENEINNKITNKEFDVILLTEGYYSFFVDKGILYQNYKLKNKLCAPMILQEWKTEIWEPKK